MGTAGSVANEFINISINTNNDLTNMRLAKLMYVAQGLSLSLLDRPIFEDDVIQAWKYGPVIPSIYHEFKHFKAQPITTKSVISSKKNWREFSEPTLTDDDDIKIVTLAWNLYKETSTEELVSATHRAGTPWSLTYDFYGENKIIENRLIKKYYDQFVVNLKNHLKSA